MPQKQKVTIMKIANTEEDYIIRDKDSINIGVFSITNLDEENRNCSVKLNFYRENDYDLLKETLKLIVQAIFKNIDINKINICTIDSINVSSFLDLGFILQGIFFDNIYFRGEYSNEISMGITRNDYYECQRINFVDLEGEDIELRLLTLENAEDLLQYYIRNKEHLRAFEPNRDNSFYTLEVQKELISESYRQFLNGTTVDMGIFKEGKLIGKVKVSNIVGGILKNGVIGYSIDQDEQGKGYMKQAVKLALEYIFREFRLHRIEASALVDNERSKNVLKACGFKELGLNEEYLFIDGKWRDHITYYITSKQMK
ncbi:MAG: GNAT family N-acetyltransferase [Clostridium sp.]|uniref:GNAT family N-acetyltransferase n=1 Tax=Clostridium sp. DSM 8431 TaxID=1761781 RepID=UPI0008E20A54|nr:GNAT family protein [Clostridium sp. DSM 8431]MCR4943345.1 GNAT family N-acetyltransferase [Clostridium sp.]SFU62357.1 ribosomal-protein-alanine N-acetyltransferase [Clostridium sp. DSM 8431]